ncbi:MAG: hypothetical protein ACREP9_01045 [Candidatus Dormibacteraceae bacterium]
MPSTADLATAHALFNCLVRELANAEKKFEAGELYLTIQLAGLDRELRARLSQLPVGPSHRLAGPVEELSDGNWKPLSWRRLAELTSQEMALDT